MPRRREHPLPKLPISLEDLQPPESKRTFRLMLSFTGDELAMIEKTARSRGEKPAVFCRNVVLTAFRNSAAKALAGTPHLLEASPAEQQRALLEIFASSE
jgi:hypothetical protein